MPRRLVVLLMLVLLATALPPAPPVAAAEPRANWDLPGLDGHFYGQTSSLPGAGFVVSNEDGIPFWDTYRRYGPAGLGYPISQRFRWEGRITQVFQRSALQFNPAAGAVEPVDLLDRLSELGLDGWLESHRGIPPPTAEPVQPFGADLLDRGRLGEGAATQELRLAAYYQTLRDPLFLLGLPTSEVHEIGAALTVRTQRGALQLWRRDMPWAKAGQVTAALAGSIAHELQVFPAGDHWLPVPTPEPPPARPIFDERTPMDPSTVTIPAGRRWIDVDLTRQRIYAMVDDQPVFWALATTGAPPWETPTGRFRINRRVQRETMDSATLGIPRDSAGGWYYDNIYFTQYFNHLPMGVVFAHMIGTTLYTVAISHLWLSATAEALGNSALALAAREGDPGRRASLVGGAADALARTRPYLTGAVFPWALAGQVAFAQARAGDASKRAVARASFAAAARQNPDDAGASVCLVHLPLLLSAVDDAAATALLRHHAQRAGDVAESMREFVVKHDARRRALMTEDERRAYREALVLLVGERALSVYDAED